MDFPFEYLFILKEIVNTLSINHLQTRNPSANSEDQDEMSQNVAFRQSLNYLLR